MSIALLLLTHAPVGQANIEAAKGTLGQLPLPVAVLDMQLDDDPDLTLQRAETMLQEIDQGDGVLVLTDLYGSTPSNIASQLIHNKPRHYLVSGLNLSMLIRTLNYASLPVEQLVEKAASGGSDGITIIPPPASQENINHA